jgi:hypothetical protein
MSFVKKKQIYGLTEDLNNLYFASPVFKRDTTLSGATPSNGEASLDDSAADEVSEVKIYTTDSSIGNHYSFLNELIAGDRVIIKSGDSFSIYSINSISSEIDSSTNEGHFILTTQHSFGYTGSFSPGELVFYFRKSISAEIDSNKYSGNHVLDNETTATITHNLNSTDVIIQIKDSNGVLLTDNLTIDNYQVNSIDVQIGLESETCRVIIMK